MTSLKEQISEQNRDKFSALCKKSPEEQRDFFIQRYVFALGDSFDEIYDITADFKRRVGDDTDIDFVGAADMLQKAGRPRTAQQRKNELQDVDVDGNGRTSLMEYFMLYYKIMILEEFFKRHEMDADVDMGNDGVGLAGVGTRLIDELFAPPLGIDPELERLMKEFHVSHEGREGKIAEIQKVIDAGGVKAMAAKAEMAKLTGGSDTADLNHIEAKIKAAMSKAKKAAVEKIAAYEETKANGDAAAIAESKARLAERMK
mmetsp:Transcript_71746/g.149804  ORF Transcript_71746/g.149804 Transcript_71746/m.149804 type:complete len:259 (-) Transcript_71746:84-860(-)|eukprot:CAMPEP_0181295412 /NCGR_PEP_ID=MMETSP1101-20121128/4137_1 /TAXON_ID=46948 /ORGANISM="Rhodomonas abbreviata, Strain Caron Lab Isolate" /LENGTH=258 /DNA_ID=CAMNT_0023400169 /DNA_START=43 /DNA_END=819 /DNA_ORIENTATION=-